MNTIRVLLAVLGCLTLGKAAVWTLGSKLPGNIVDMDLLSAVLQTGRVKLSQMEGLADILMANPTLFSVPSCAATISHLDAIANDWPSILTVTIASTVCVLLVMGKVYERVGGLMR